jgi:hypothetical protein
MFQIDENLLKKMNLSNKKKNFGPFLQTEVFIFIFLHCLVLFWFVLFCFVFR